MKKVIALLFMVLPIQSFAALEITSITEKNSVLRTTIPSIALKECQVVLHVSLSQLTDGGRLELQHKESVEVSKTEAFDDDGGKSITFWISDNLVRNINCLTR